MEAEIIASVLGESVTIILMVWRLIVADRERLMLMERCFTGDYPDDDDNPE